MVFPNKVVSQQIVSYEEQQIVQPTAVYEQADTDKVKSAILTAKAKQTDYSSCVTFAKRLTGYLATIGAARNWPTNAEIPLVGGVVVLNEGKYGHVGVITAVNADSFTIVEANYIPNQKSSRTLNINNLDIKGFWKAVK